MCDKEKKVEVKQPTTYDEQVKKIIEHGCIVGAEGYAKLQQKKERAEVTDCFPYKSKSKK